MGWVCNFTDSNPQHTAFDSISLSLWSFRMCSLYYFLSSQGKLEWNLLGQFYFFPKSNIFLLFMRSETFTIFSGGLSTERDGKSPCITVLQGRSTTVLEMEHPVVDFITICESPWSSGMFFKPTPFPMHRHWMLFGVFVFFLFLPQQKCKNHMPSLCCCKTI